MNKDFEVIIIGGSYAGLAAGMALGRALRRVLIIDSGRPCNRQTPHSHNFLTQDGVPPATIAGIGREQVAAYDTVQFLPAKATSATRTEDKFTVFTDGGAAYTAGKLLFATGVLDIMPAIDGFAACWGISVLHCPYCHGYEVRRQPTAILANGDIAFELGRLISHWTDDLTVLTNGPSTISEAMQEKLAAHNIRIVEHGIRKLTHDKGQVSAVVFDNGQQLPVKAIYARPAMEQHSGIPASLGCIAKDGLLTVDDFQQTNVPGIYAAGDNTNMMRSVAMAVAAGTKAGAVINKFMIDESF